MKSKFKTKWVKLSDLPPIKFGGLHEPYDKKFAELYKNAIEGKLLVRVAFIVLDFIKPFSDFKPKISDEYREFFEEMEKEDNPLLLNVYPEGNHFIMEDDYLRYYVYKEKKQILVYCILYGESDNPYIISKSELFQLPLPGRK